jgi:SAM-dependent methyltransferase
LDLGCGIGGPAFTVAQTTGARIVGINSSPQQLRVLSRRSRHGFRVVGADYARLPFPSDRFDRAYAFEALCHAVDLEAVFREVRRVLRRGSRLAFSEWCLTDRFDSGDVGHEELRRTIEASYGVVRLRTWREWEAALDGAGFCIDTSIDRGVTDLGGADEEPWYKALQPRDRSLDSLTRDSRIRRWSATVLTLAERCGLASPGTTAMIQRLREGTAALIEAGERGIFTPMRFVVATAGRSR